MAGTDQTPFGAHVGLLRQFITQRDSLIERIQGLLNAQQKPAAWLQDRATLSRQFEDCFFGLPDITRDQIALRGRLQDAHWAEGFRPRDMPGIPNEMFDPADMMVRAFTVWRHTRWPGRNGRLRYAQTLFNLYVVRCLALLCMRLGDDGPAMAGERLRLLQALLDDLWVSSPADQPVLVRDVRWLVPVAQSPTTDELAPYFEAARRFEECLPAADRLEIHKASVLMAGGHLRSQLRHFEMQGRSLEDRELALSTRGSNALDCAMTIQHLAPLLAAYGDALEAGDENLRSALAGVVCQGISPDPDLFVNRLELLRAYSMIEHLFVSVDGDGQAALTPMGLRHVALVEQYVQLMEQHAGALADDCAAFSPQPGSYSPYGVMFGFSSNILEHMTLKAMQPDAEIRFSLEDVFSEGGSRVERLAWVSGWRRLPHVPADILKLYEYPQPFAEVMHARVCLALRSRTQGGIASRPPCGRLIIGAGDETAAAYMLSSDPRLVAEGKARSYDQGRLSGDRNEGMFLASYPTPGGWMAISKDLLTGVLGEGRDFRTGELPAGAAHVLRIMCSGLVGGAV